MRLYRVYLHPIQRFWMSSVGTALLLLGLLPSALAMYVLDLDLLPHVLVVLGVGSCTLMLVETVALNVWFHVRHGRKRRGAYRDADEAWERGEGRAYVDAVGRLDGDVDL